MPKVYIELDYEVVEKAIAAKVPAAVEEILRRYDLQRIIESAILSDKKQEIETPSSPDSIIMRMWGPPQPSSPRERFEQNLEIAIQSAIEKEATKLLAEKSDILREALERALPKTLANLRLKVELADDDD